MLSVEFSHVDLFITPVPDDHVNSDTSRAASLRVDFLNPKIKKYLDLKHSPGLKVTIQVQEDDILYDLKGKCMFVSRC